MPSTFIIIVAAGSGSRMQRELPKPFLKLKGREIIAHTIGKFKAANSELKFVIAVNRDYVPLMKEIAQKNGWPDILITEGGDTRFHSVKNALAAISESEGIVGIHDAARPLVSVQTIRNCYDTALKQGNATPAVPVNETLRELSGEESRTVSRSLFRIIQTPQCFRLSEIKAAFAQPYSESFTDDASVLEAFGKKIVLVEGNAENIKITYPKDIIIAEALLEHEK